MNTKKFTYVYGPVPSWRLGISLGIDPVSKGRKICSFDCIYCQIGKTDFLTDERRNFISTEGVLEEMDSLPSINIDYITFSGSGEPTLAKNLGQMIRAIKKIRTEKIAVITNSSLMYRTDVQEDLGLADCVVAKLDAHNQDMLGKVNRPLSTITLDKIISGIKQFKKGYRGKLALQMMFIEPNKGAATELAQIARDIQPDEVQINTPLRPCKVKPLSEAALNDIEKYFKDLNVISVYKAEKKHTKPISDQDTLQRRGKT